MEKKPVRKKLAPVPPPARLIPPPEAMDFDSRLRQLPTSFGTKYGSACLGFLSPCACRITVLLTEQAHGCECGAEHHAHLDLYRESPRARWRTAQFFPPEIWLDPESEGVVPVARSCAKDVYLAAAQHLSFHPSLPFDVLEIVWQRGVHECHYWLQEYQRSLALLQEDRQS